MSVWLTDNEPAIRLAAFLGVFALVATWEIASARRELRIARFPRWRANLLLVAGNTLLLRVVTPTAAVGAAVLAAERGWGLMHALEMPPAVALVASVLLLDLAIYLQHVMFHAVPLLWRLHMVHHADLDYDVTTGSRFHPIEILLSMGIKLALVTLIGAPAAAVILFEVILASAASFNHGNVKLPAAVDRLLRLVIVTPDMHRVHHSTVARESNSNFGFNVPWWDRLFGTYKAQPEAGHEDMEIGVAQLQQDEPQSLWWMLALPFVGDPGEYAIRRRSWE